MSLKNRTIYIEGRQNIGKSFVAAKPRAAAVSKRLLIDAPNRDGSVSITFCLDLHRAECSPGLGDVTKNIVLLYRCNNQHITNVWGMTDIEGLSNDKSLSLTSLIASKTWQLAVALIEEDILELNAADSTNTYVHFHNYDNMDTWG